MLLMVSTADEPCLVQKEKLLTSLSKSKLELVLSKSVSVGIKILALAIVGAILFSIVDGKFDQLKQTNAAWSSGNYVSVADKTRELECLTRNIYWEAASEPFEGKVAVAQVTLNRVESGRFANSVCGVVTQKNVIYEKVICQFSWYCEGNYKVKPVHKPLWRESEEVAKKVYLEGFRLPGMTKAMYYHADYVSPNWNKPRIGEIGRHIFYGER
jgi:spore germination cell wall hydrolase CwlJ-like protein